MLGCDLAWELVLELTLTFNPRAVVMIQTYAEGQRSVISKDKEWKQMDRRAEAIALRLVLMQSVKIQKDMNLNGCFAVVVVVEVMTESYSHCNEQ